MATAGAAAPFRFPQGDMPCVHICKPFSLWSGCRRIFVVAGIPYEAPALSWWFWLLLFLTFFFFFNVGWSCFHLECVYIVTNRKNTMRTGQSYLDRQVPRWQGPSLMGLLHCLLWCIWCLRLFASREYRSSAQKRQNCVYFSRDWSDWCLEVSKVKWEANG